MKMSCYIWNSLIINKLSSLSPDFVNFVVILLIIFKQNFAMRSVIMYLDV